MRYEYTWLYLTDRYKEYYRDNPESAPDRIQDYYNQHIKHNDSWLGATREEMLSYLDQGYEFPEINSDLLPQETASEGSRFFFTDDPTEYGAEYQYDVDEMGDSEYYLARKRTKSKPGIAIRIDMGFHAGINASQIAKYGKWCGSLVSSLEANGYDLEIELYSNSSSLIVGEDRTENVVKVSKFGETVFFEDWSAIFAPGGYRHLNHLTKMLASEQGKRIPSSIGHPIATGYGVVFNTEERVLTIMCGAEPFDFKFMNNRLEKVKEQING